VKRQAPPMKRRTGKRSGRWRDDASSRNLPLRTLDPTHAERPLIWLLKRCPQTNPASSRVANGH
jgi:hypothetical protein